MLERIELTYQARSQFVSFHKRQQRFACCVCHRRAGKTVACVHDLLDGALRCTLVRPRFAYLSPFLKQSKTVAWDYLRAAVQPLRALGATLHESELRADLHNGGQVRLYGADNPDALRGIYLDGVVLDEYADMDPRVWAEIIRPALADRQGWAVFIGTPRGHNAFYDLWQRSQSEEGWFSLMLKASETGLISSDELALARRDLSEDQYAQEFECSFEAAIQGAYYAKHLETARKQGRIGKVAPDPLMQVRAFFDLGGAGATADAMAIWICQFVGQQIRVLDYIEGIGQVLAYYVNLLRQRGWGDAHCYLPHDGVNANSITGKRYEDHVRDAGFGVTVIPNQGRGAAMMRVEAARRVFAQCWFNEDTTESGRNALSCYHERRDDVRNVGLGPLHDWSSHCADAFGLMAIVHREAEIISDDDDAPMSSVRGRSSVTGY